MSETNVNTLTINKLTKAQYNTSSKSATELWFVTDETTGVQQYDTMPTAASTNENQIAQFTGTTTSTYTNGYFYKCTAQGTTPETYAWTQVNVQPASSGSSTWGSITGTLSSQTDLQTALDAKQNTLTVGSNVQIDATTNTISATDTTYTAGSGISIDASNVISSTITVPTKISDLTDDTATNPIDKADTLTGLTTTVSELNYMSGVTSAVQSQLDSKQNALPTLVSGQYLTNDGTNLSWHAVDELPTQTGNAGKFLTTDGTDASWSTNLPNSTTVSQDTSNPLGNALKVYAYESSSGVKSLMLYHYVSNDWNQYISFDGSSSSITFKASGGNGYIRINGNQIYAGSAYSSYIGQSNTPFEHGYISYLHPYSSSDSLRVPYGTGVLGACLTSFPSASQTWLGCSFQYAGTTDSTYTNGYFYRCVSDGAASPTYSWERVDVQPSSGGGSSSATATLAVADWSNNTQTVTVSGVTASNNVIVAAAPASQSAYTTAGILCTAQAADSLTFTCTTVPTTAITVNVIILS